MARFNFVVQPNNSANEPVQNQTSNCSAHPTFFNTNLQLSEQIYNSTCPDHPTCEECIKITIQMQSGPEWDAIYCGMCVYAGRYRKISEGMTKEQFMHKYQVPSPMVPPVNVYAGSSNVPIQSEVQDIPRNYPINHVTNWDPCQTHRTVWNAFKSFNPGEMKYEFCQHHKMCQQCLVQTIFEQALSPEDYIFCPECRNFDTCTILNPIESKHDFAKRYLDGTDMPNPVPLNPMFVPTEDCKICMDSISPDEVMKLENCGHYFHLSCIAEGIKSAVENRQVPVTCFEINCNEVIPDSNLLLWIEPEDYAKYNAMVIDDYIGQQEDIGRCPTPDCRNAVIIDPQNPRFDWSSWNKSYCLRCKVDYHTGQSCESYLADKEASSDDKFAEAAGSFNYKQCSQCKFWVEKSSGCDHMTCRWGYEFCYICGGKYKECPHT